MSCAEEMPGRSGAEAEHRPVPGEILLPSRHTVLPQDRELFDRLLGTFVPPAVFDAHAHLYPLAAAGFGFERLALHKADVDAGLGAYRRATSAWMGDRCPTAGLFFGIPSSPNVDVIASNRFVSDEVSRQAGAKGLMLVGPQDDPAAVEAAVREDGFAGFKVYHTFARRSDTLEAELDEYLPDWMWEVAHRRGLVIMLHLVKPRALGDGENQASLRRSLRRWSGARLILAHAGRGFCAHHTIEGIGSLAGFDNVFFDTSGICEPGPLLAVLGQFGPGRLMYGSDFPISNIRGRIVSIGDGFAWMSEDNVDWRSSRHGSPTLVGIEALLALKQASTFARLGDSEVEDVFHHNARSLLA
jgi:glutamate-1-semialdehyde 2,1-aminomutase